MPKKQSKTDSAHKRRLHGVVKHPSAIARDKWLASKDGQECTNGTTWGQYLENRLVRAFLAGWDAAKKDA